jgi:hypothetical protein
MKKYFIYFILSLVLYSCTGLLDTNPRNQITDGNMWKTASLSKAGMDGLMYPFMRRTDRINPVIEYSGRVGLNRIGIEGMGYTSVLDGNVDFLKSATKYASGPENTAEWKSMFTVIQACNKAITRLKKEVVGEKLYNQYICEARMIRAYCYSRLNMVFGMVPIYLEEVNNEDCTKTQSSWDEVWDMVIKECTACLENPDFQTNNFTGERLYKPSKGMAYAVRGNAYMWLAANMNSEIGEGGENISDAEVKAYYTLAAADFAKVKECGFGLWAGKWEDLFLTANEHNSEMIFPLEFGETFGYTSTWNWIIGSRTNLNAWNRIVPNTDFVDDFQWADGSEFDWAQIFPDWNTLKDYQREVFFLRDSLETFHNIFVSAPVDEKGNKIAPEKVITMEAQREKVIGRVGQDIYDTYYIDLGNEAKLRTAYDTRDPRLDKMVITPYKQYRLFFADTPLMYQLRWPRFKRQDDVEDSDIWLELSANMVYSWYKYLVTDGSVLTRGMDSTDWPIIRYTQIQLMWAEALVQTGKTAEALVLLNEIRSRAGMPDVTSTDPATVMKEIQYVTRVELAQEGKDFFNEIRWGTYYEYKFQSKKLYGIASCWGQIGWKSGYYYVNGMWPLSAPLSEVVKNTNLKRRSKGWAY